MRPSLFLFLFLAVLSLSFPFLPLLLIRADHLATVQASTAATATRAERHKIHRRATAHDRHAPNASGRAMGRTLARLVCLTP